MHLFDNSFHFSPSSFFPSLPSFQVDLLINEAFAGAISSFYLMGGAVPESTDRMNSLSPLRRDAALARLCHFFSD